MIWLCSSFIFCHFLFWWLYADTLPVPCSEMIICDNMNHSVFCCRILLPTVMFQRFWLHVCTTLNRPQSAIRREGIHQPYLETSTRKMEPIPLQLPFSPFLKWLLGFKNPLITHLELGRYTHIGVTCWRSQWNHLHAGSVSSHMCEQIRKKFKHFIYFYGDLNPVCWQKSHDSHALHTATCHIYPILGLWGLHDGFTGIWLCRLPPRPPFQGMT